MVGAKDREANKITAKAVKSIDKETLQRFVKDWADLQATVYADVVSSSEALPFEHETVQHSLSKFGRGKAHTNEVESIWFMLKRGSIGTCHKKPPKHFDCYVVEFSRRHNLRMADTLDQLELITLKMGSKRLQYKDPKKENGLGHGAREMAA